MTTHQAPNQPIDLIVFDCDGTLTALEGAVYLAALKGQKEAVAQLTERAMQQGIMHQGMFDARLALIQPNLQDMAQLTQAYHDARTPNIDEVCKLLMKLDKTIWVASAGFQPSVGAFAEQLGIPKTHAHAVSLNFDSQGQFVNLPENQDFCRLDGKKTLLHQARPQFKRIAMIGDGANDFACADATDHFIGFGGHYPRPQFRQHCQHYVECPDARVLLPLLLTLTETQALDPQDKTLYAQGLKLIEQQQAVHFSAHWAPLSA